MEAITIEEMNDHLDQNDPMLINTLRMLTHFDRAIKDSSAMESLFTYEGDKKKLLRDIVQHLHDIVNLYWKTNYVHSMSRKLMYNVWITSDFNDDKSKSRWCNFTAFLANGMDEDKAKTYFNIVKPYIEKYCYNVCEYLSDEFDLDLRFHHIVDYNFAISINP